MNRNSSLNQRNPNCVKNVKLDIICLRDHVRLCYIDCSDYHCYINPREVAWHQQIRGILFYFCCNKASENIGGRGIPPP